MGASHARFWSRLLVLGAIFWAFIAKSRQNLPKLTLRYPHEGPWVEWSREGSWCSRKKGDHPRPFVGVSQKSIFKRPCQVLAINAHKMAPRTSKRLQERAWDAPTKGLLWTRTRQSRPRPHPSVRTRQPQSMKSETQNPKLETRNPKSETRSRPRIRQSGREARVCLHKSSRPLSPIPSTPTLVSYTLNLHP